MCHVCPRVFCAYFVFMTGDCLHLINWRLSFNCFQCIEHVIELREIKQSVTKSSHCLGNALRLLHNISSTSIATWARMYSRTVITVFGQKAQNHESSKQPEIGV